MTHRRALRATAFGTLLVVVTALIIALVLVITFVRRPLPERGGNVTMPGLNGKVTVLRDEQAVPQIYADDAEDLFRVQGYVNAQDRFFEMDLRRHITAGRLSELVGENKDALRSDKVVRTLGWRQVAAQELDRVSSSTRRYLQAYADGVNEYVSGRSASELSLSYTALGRANKLRPIDEWTPVDSLAWLKAMAWDLRSNYNEELERAQAYDTVTDVGRVEQLYPAFPYNDHQPIITGDTRSSSASLLPKTEQFPKTKQLPKSEQLPKTKQAPTKAGSKPTVKANAKVAAGTGDAEAMVAALQSTAAQQVLDSADKAIAAIPQLLGRGDGIGSNSWVVGRELTTTGLPLLANDPHLKASMPGVWTQVGLHCTTVSASCPFDVAGFGFAGMPGVVIGHNARIAWGLTNLYPDVTDFYLERIDSAGQVERDGKSVPMTTRTEMISVAGKPQVPVVIRSTSHGPVISDVIGDIATAGNTAPAPGEKHSRDTRYAVSLAWTALRPGTAMDALLELDVARDFDSFRAAVKKLDAPAQNVVYADVDGHIGYQAPGRIPLRGPGRKDSLVPANGTWPHPGWDSSYDWTGFVDVKDLPWVQDPADGFIVAANQAVTGPDGAVKITSDWDYGYRSERIRTLLQEAKTDQRPLSVDDMRAIQADSRNGIAELLVPLLQEVGIRNKDDKDPMDAPERFAQDGVDLLTDWDYNQHTDSPAAAYFNMVWATILDLAFGDELPEGFKPDGGDRWFEVVRSLLPENSKKDRWWDDRGTADVVESRDEVLRRSMISARDELTKKLGKDPKHWQWGRLHQLTLEQVPLGDPSVNAPLRRLFNRGPYAAPGGTSIVNAFSWDASALTDPDTREKSFDVTAAPSMRMIIDLADLNQSRWVNQTGISGHPGDTHYDDQLDTWLKGEDYAWPFFADAVQAAKSDEQIFTPGPT